MEEKIILYHGSSNIIEKPIYGNGKTYNDYGRAFYCTQDIDLAKEWAVDMERDGYSNKYEIDLSGLKILNLNSDEYTIIHWITVLLCHREFEIQSDFGKEAKQYLLNNFYVDVDKYDIIRGYRADDSYFSFAQDFLNNNISIKNLSRAMQLGRLGEQYAVKSKQAFERLSFIEIEVVSHMKWYPGKEQRDYLARKHYSEIRNERWQRGETYIMQMLEEEMKADDVRLRPDIAK